MQYRVGRPEDWPGISELLGATDVYLGVDAAVLADGGHWLVAEDEQGLAACAWVLASGQHCYVDCLAVRPDKQNSGLGARMSVRIVQFARDLGVRHLRAITVSPVVGRIAQSLGGLAHEGGYTQVYVPIGE